MHENYIRDGAVVEAFEIIMRQMITPRDATTPHYGSRDGVRGRRKKKKEETRLAMNGWGGLLEKKKKHGGA